MDSSSVGNLMVISPQRFLIGAVRCGLLTLALPSSYMINERKSSVLENFVLTASLSTKIALREAVSARRIYLFNLGFVLVDMIPADIKVTRM